MVPLLVTVPGERWDVIVAGGGTAGVITDCP